MLYNKIKTLCKENGITIYRLEKDCGLSQNSILKWQKSSPSIENLKKVADRLNVPIDYLLGVGLYGKLDLIENNLDTILSAIGNCKFPDMQEWLYKQLIEYLRIVKKLPILNVIPFLELFIKDINYDEETNALKIHWNFK